MAHLIKNSKMLINIFRGLTDSEPKDTTLEEVVHLITDDASVRDLTDKYRYYLSMSDERQARRFKELLPCFAVAVRFSGGKHKRNISAYTGLTIVDIDHVPAEKMQQVLALVREDPHTLLAYTTVSGLGVRVIARFVLNEDGNTKHYTLNAAQDNSHADFNENDNENENCLRNVALNLTQNTQNSQNGKSLRPCGHPEGTVVRCPLSVDLIETEAPRLLFLSNLIPSKGVYVLLDACKVLRERGLQFVCDFVGGETKEIDRATFEAAVKERGLESHVIYHGPQYGEDKHRFFMNADVFVQPTFDDCFPLTLVEAMQYSLPIASTDVGAIPDMVQDGVNGFVCKQQDVDSLVNALEQLITNPALRQQMGEAGYQRYKELYTLEAFEKRFVELLSV